MSIVNLTKLALVGLAGIVAAACSDASSPVTPQISGSFTLAKINGRTLPDTEAFQPSREPGKPDCAILRQSGKLALNAESGTFSITVNAVNSCGGAEWVLLTETGSFEQHEQTLTMSEPFPDHVETFAGTIDGQSIAVHGVFYDYTFAR
jgi:hypothetical protein